MKGVRRPVGLWLWLWLGREFQREDAAAEKAPSPQVRSLALGDLSVGCVRYIHRRRSGGQAIYLWRVRYRSSQNAASAAIGSVL